MSMVVKTSLSSLASSLVWRMTDFFLQLTLCAWIVSRNKIQYIFSWEKDLGMTQQKKYEEILDSTKNSLQKLA